MGKPSVTNVGSCTILSNKPPTAIRGIALANDPLSDQVGGNHYKSMKIQPVEFCYVNDIPYLEGNIIKYICRHRAKGGEEDLLKALHYLNILIEFEYGHEEG